MMHGDWRLQHVGRSDELPLVLAVYLLVAVVIVFVLCKLGFSHPDPRRRR